MKAAFHRPASAREPSAAERPLEDDEPIPPSLRWSDPAAVEEATLGVGSPFVSPRSRMYVEPDEEERPAPIPSGDLHEHLRALEARLDGMLHQAAPEASRPTPPPRPAVPPAEVPLGPDDNIADAHEDPHAEPDRIRQSPFYRRVWGALGHRSRAEHVDEFGLDPDYEARFARPLLDALYRYYFRVKVVGIEHVPATGCCQIVANHSGTLPLDGPMLRAALRLDHPSGRDLRWLAEDFVYYLPFAGTTLTRIGAVRACPENAERLLRHGQCVASFPEGVRGIAKPYRDRYQLQRFGRGGFVRIALRTGAPLIPCAIVGAEETSPLIYREELLAKWIGLPYVPITPTFPWLGPVGLLPAPTRWTVYFGEPFDLGGYGPGAADDDVLVSRLAEHVRAHIQRMLDEGVNARGSVWFG